MDRKKLYLAVLVTIVLIGVLAFATWRSHPSSEEAPPFTGETILPEDEVLAPEPTPPPAEQDDTQEEAAQKMSP